MRRHPAERRSARQTLNQVMERRRDTIAASVQGLERIRPGVYVMAVSDDFTLPEAEIIAQHLRTTRGWTVLLDTTPAPWK